MLEKLVNSLLGKPGRALFNFIQNHYEIFLLIMMVYGLLILYAKRNYITYIPNQIRKIIAENPNASSEEVYKIWQQHKKQIPNYILIPTKNDLWVTPLNKADDNYDLLEYFKGANYKNDTELINRIKKQNSQKKNHKGLK